MSDVEKVHVKLGISGTFWDKRPEYRVLFNDTVVKEGTAGSDVEYIDFTTEYSGDQVALRVQLLNKDSGDTVENADKTAIVKDMLLNIVSLEVDEIDLGQLIFTESIYTPDTPVVVNGETTQTVRNCLNLGWNGTWELTWTNPFYIWLLEKI